jgi:hypothetical protein
VSDRSLKSPESGLTKRFVETSPGVHAEEIGIIVSNTGRTVAAGQNDQILGTTGAAGDYLAYLLVTPETTSPGEVSIRDGAGARYTLFVGGASSVSSLAPFVLFIGEFSQAGGWQVTTGASVHVRATGRFT